MPRGCKWHHVSDYFIDSIGCSETFRMYVAQDSKGIFHYKGSGDEDLFEDFDRVDVLIDFFAHYGEDILRALRSTVAPLKDYEAVVRMIDFRLKSKNQLTSVAAR